MCPNPNPGNSEWENTYFEDISPSHPLLQIKLEIQENLNRQTFIMSATLNLQKIKAHRAQKVFNPKGLVSNYWLNFYIHSKSVLISTINFKTA